MSNAIKDDYIPFEDFVKDDVFYVNKDFSIDDVYEYDFDLFGYEGRIFSYIVVDPLNEEFLSIKNSNCLITRFNTLVLGTEHSIIPHGVKGIAGFAFKGAGPIDVIIPNTVTESCDCAFNNSMLKNLILEEGLTNFLGCPLQGDIDLESLSLPKSFTEFDLSSGIFDGRYVHHIKVHKDNPRLKMIKGCLVDLKTSTLIRITDDFEGIPDNIKTIHKHAFELFKNKAIKSLRFDKTLENVEFSTFNGAHLKTLYFDGELKDVEELAFSSDWLDYVYSPKTSIKILPSIYNKVLLLKGWVRYYFKNKAKVSLKEKQDYDDFISDNYQKMFKDEGCIKDKKLISYIANEYKIDQAIIADFIAFLQANKFDELSTLLLIRSNAIKSNDDTDFFKEKSSTDFDKEIDRNWVVNIKDNKAILKRYCGKNDLIYTLPTGVYQGHKISYDKDCFKYNMPKRIIITQEFLNTIDFEGFADGNNFEFEDGITSFDINMFLRNVVNELWIPKSIKHIDKSKNEILILNAIFKGSKEEFKNANIEKLILDVSLTRTNIALAKEYKEKPYFDF